MTKMYMRGGVYYGTAEDMIDRIEELEAAIENSKYFLEMHFAYSDADCRVLIKKALAELKVETHE